MNFFLIPGNPPAAYFYEQWGREIKGLAPDTTSYVSHYPDLKAGISSLEAMGEVTNFHLEQLQKFASEASSPVTIMGHSLGAYFALKLLEREPELIHKTIFLHPFLRTPSIRGTALLQVVSSLSGAPRFQQTILKHRKHLERLNRDLPHVTREEIVRSFHLAKHEHATIGKDRSPLVIRPDLREKVQVFHYKKDDWCTPDVLNQLRQQVQVFECRQPHGFITSQLHRRDLYNLIVSK